MNNYTLFLFLLINTKLVFSWRWSRYKGTYTDEFNTKQNYYIVAQDSCNSFIIFNNYETFRLPLVPNTSGKPNIGNGLVGSCAKGERLTSCYNQEGEGVTNIWGNVYIPFDSYTKKKVRVNTHACFNNPDESSSARYRLTNSSINGEVEFVNYVNGYYLTKYGWCKQNDSALYCKINNECKNRCLSKLGNVNGLAVEMDGLQVYIVIQLNIFVAKVIVK